MIKPQCVVTVGDCKDLNSTYDVHELAPYKGRTGLVQMVDEAQEEAYVVFFDYFCEAHYEAEKSNWFPLEQLSLTSFELEDLDMAESK